MIFGSLKSVLINKSRLNKYKIISGFLILLKNIVTTKDNDSLMNIINQTIMTTNLKKGDSIQRITIIDALRGFALAGIVFAHMLENFLAAPLPQAVLDTMNQGVVDQIASGFVDFLFRGKFFALFSFLFGLSFFIQMDNGHKRGGYYGWRFLWRLILLLSIGYIHSLFYRGDILTIYALIGLLLIPFYKIQNKWVLTLVTLLFLGIGRFVVFYFTSGNPLLLDEALMPGSPAVESYYILLKEGSLGEVFAANAIDGHLNKFEFQFGVFSRGYLTFAFFLLGLYVGRIGFFSRFKEINLKKYWISSLLLFLLSLVAMIMVFANLGPEAEFNSWLAMVGLTFFDLMNLGMTLLILIVFTLLYKRKKTERLLSKFAPYGRMALTNYVLQSVVGTFFFYGWGLNYLGELRNSYVFLIAIGLIAIQMWLSRLWLKKFKYGPLEWLWRSATFFKWFPLLKTRPV